MSSGIMYHVSVSKGVKKWGVDWTQSLQFLTSKKHMEDLAKGYRYYINQYVPKESGRLRKSARPKGTMDGAASGSARVYWGTTTKTEKYVHYQFIGDVYKTNKPIFYKNGKQKGWVSPKGALKENTGRKMGDGTPFSFEYKPGLWATVKGYTTKGTKYNWIKEFHDDKGDRGETAINIRAGRYMYERFCIERRKHDKSAPPAVGGYHIYRSWNQIKNRID